MLAAKLQPGGKLLRTLKAHIAVLTRICLESLQTQFGLRLAYNTTFIAAA